MHLQRTTAQNGEPIESLYRELLSSPFPAYRALAEEMLELLARLQEDIVAPPHYVTTSHFSFYLSSVDHWDHWKARLFVHPHRQGFMIRYRCDAALDWEKSFTTLVARSVLDAAEKIILALELALTNPPGRFEQDGHQPDHEIT